MDLPEIPQMSEPISLSESSDIKHENEEALPDESQELFDISDLNFLLPKLEVNPIGTISGISEPCKLEPDTQELDLAYFDNEGVENTSSSGSNTFPETSNSSPSLQHHILAMSSPPRISSLPSELDIQEGGCNDDEMVPSTVCNSDAVTQSKRLGPKLVVLIKRLDEKIIAELKSGIWRCGSCGKTEKSFLMLDLHIDTGCEKLSPIECDVCPAVVRNYTNFVCHFMEHQMGDKRRCPICLRVNIDDMKKHLILQGHFSPDVCQLNGQKNIASCCTNQYKTAQQDSASSVVVAQNLSKSECSNSFESPSKAKGLKNQKAFSTSCLYNKKERKVERHEEIQTKQKPYKCDVCTKCFSKSSYLSVHQRMHTGVKPFKCTVCKKSFSILDSLNKHQRVHTGQKPFKCDICEKAFSQMYNLKRHQSVHTGAKPFMCDLCKTRFSSWTSLNKHLRVHTGEKPYKCKICTRSFSEIGNLTRHQRVHTGQKPFRCDVCHKSFTSSSYFKTHQRLHTGEKPFKCTICKKSFSLSSSLNRHQTVHTGQKLFKCDICEKRFVAISTLAKHKKLHTGNKPFKCNICQKTFALAGYLSNHRKMHLSVKPFKCGTCQRTFSFQSNLIHHLKARCRKKPATL